MNNLQNELENLENERKELFALRAPIDEKITSNYEKIKELREQIAVIRVDEMKAENFVPSAGNFFSPKELELVLVGDHNNGTLYGYAEHLMQDRFGFAFSRYGYCHETGQSSYKIALVKGDSERTNLIKNAILYFLPHLKWRTKDGYDRDLTPHQIRFDIFEHNLSAGGRSYDLVYTSDDKWYIEERWRKTEYPTLDAALVFIENNLWYERKKSDGSKSSPLWDDDEFDDYDNDDD